MSVVALDFGGDAVAPELAYVTARYAALPPFGKVAAWGCPGSDTASEVGVVLAGGWAFLFGA